MKVERKDGSKERKILTTMVVSDTVLGKISNNWTEKGLFPSTWSNLIGGWCVDYFRKYQKAPSKNIQSLFQSWAEESQTDKETVRIVEKFLGEMSGEYTRLKKEVNPEYVIDTAGDYFNSVRLEKTMDAIRGDLDTGKVSKALQKAEQFGRKIEIGGGSGIDLFTDEQEVKSTFEYQRESLIRFPGRVGAGGVDSVPRTGETR
jgi:hypothetical protein